MAVSIRGKLSPAAISLMLFVCAAGWFWFGVLWPHERHRRWYREIECLIIELAPRCPPEITPNQWANCLLHTWNLHTNYGNLTYWELNRRDKFATEFRDRLHRRVGLDTIDWFWDAYAQAVPRSRSYLRYRPTSPEQLDEADSLQGGYDLDHWLTRRDQVDCERLLGAP